jgi:hypothetical protein
VFGAGRQVMHVPANSSEPQEGHEVAGRLMPSAYPPGRCTSQAASGSQLRQAAGIVGVATWMNTCGWGIDGA